MAGNDDYTVSLLHLDGDNNSTTITDDAHAGTHTWTANGGAALVTAEKKFGTASLYIDGDGDYIDTPDSADWAMGSGDFTVDFWMKRTRAAIHEMILGQVALGGANATCGITVYMESWNAADTTMKSLLHFEGANDSTVIIESARWRGDTGTGPRVWTCRNHAKISTTSPKFGSGSAYFDGTDDYIDTPDSTDFTMGSGDFTVEMWIKRGRNATLERVTGQLNDTGATTSLSWGFRFNADDTLMMHFASGSNFYSGSTAGTISDTDTWHHLAMVRYGNTVKMYIDGVADANTVDITGVTLNDSARNLSIGRLGEYASGYFQGYIDEYRIYKGTAKYTSNFTPSTIEFIYDRIWAAFCVGSGGFGIIATTDISDTTTWHHIALARSGNTMYLFIDGILQGTVDVTGQTMNDSAYKFAIGREGEAPVCLFKGYIDEVRISKGIARWTEGFEVPTEGYYDSTVYIPRYGFINFQNPGIA